MNQKNKDRDNQNPSHTAEEICRIGRTTYLICHHFSGTRHLENILERLILNDKSLF